MGESVDLNDQGPPVDGAGQDTQRGGPDAQTARSEGPRSCEGQHALAVESPSATRASRFFSDVILAKQNSAG